MQNTIIPPLFATLDSLHNRVIEWQRQMTSRPAIGPDNGGTGEDEKAHWLTEELQRMGVAAIQQLPATDPRVPSGVRHNIVATIAGKSTRTLWIVGHMDVVPPGDIRLWHSAPYELVVDGDILIGRGVEDNQQAIATALLVAETLLKKQSTPDLTYGMIFVSDEETGMEYGLPHILKVAPDLIGKDDIVLVPDMGNEQGDMVEIVEKGCLWLKCTIHGKQCHASTPNIGINSLVVASECIIALHQLHGIFSEVDERFAPSWSTFVPSKKEANVENINTMPGKDVFYIDCRVLPQYSLQDVYDQCVKILEETAAKHDARAELQIIHSAPCSGETPAGCDGVLRLSEALRKVRNIEPRLCGAGGQTEAAFLRAVGIPALVWSTIFSNAHVPNECSSITNTILDAKVATYMLFDL